MRIRQIPAGVLLVGFLAGAFGVFFKARPLPASPLPRPEIERQQNVTYQTATFALG